MRAGRQPSLSVISPRAAVARLAIRLGLALASVCVGFLCRILRASRKRDL